MSTGGKRKMSLASPTITPDAEGEFVAGAKEPQGVVEPFEAEPVGGGGDDTDAPPLSPSQRKAMSGGPGRPRKTVRPPWADAPAKSDRMTLILQGRDKARLDWMSRTLDRPAQRILRQYVENQLRADASKLFRDLHPHSEIEDDGDK